MSSAPSTQSLSGCSGDVRIGIQARLNQPGQSRPRPNCVGYLGAIDPIRACTMLLATFIHPAVGNMQKMLKVVTYLMMLVRSRRASRRPRVSTSCLSFLCMCWLAGSVVHLTEPSDVRHACLIIPAAWPSHRRSSGRQLRRFINAGRLLACFSKRARHVPVSVRDMCL